MNSEEMFTAWEDSLRRHDEVPLRDFWRCTVPETMERAEQQSLLFELAGLEFEYRWKQGVGVERATAAAVNADFVELCDRDLQSKLVAEEFRARVRFGDRPAIQDFASEWRGLLESVDRELKAEFGKHIERNLLPIAEPRIPFAGQFDPRAPLPAADYLVQRFLGAGALGRVYVAWQRSLQRRVALKFLRKHFVRNTAAVDRFLQEARLAGGLRHPGIISVHGLWRTPGGSYFLAMDLISGGPLQPIAAHDPRQLAQLLDSIAQAAEAMTAAHASGVIHCDLKPANILRDDSGRVTLTDFGLARQLADETLHSPRGEGTPACIAPEQIDACWGPVGPTTDVFNLAATLFMLLTGRSPHEGNSVPEMLASAVSGRPVRSLRSLAPALDELCTDCLRKSQDRPTMGEFAARLRQLGSIE